MLTSQENVGKTLFRLVPSSLAETGADQEQAVTEQNLSA